MQILDPEDHQTDLNVVSCVLHGDGRYHGGVANLRHTSGLESS